MRYNKETAQWSRFMVLGFTLGNAAVFNGKLLVSDLMLSRYLILDPATRSVQKYPLGEGLFNKEQPQELVFESGSYGCFHSKK